MAESRGYPSGIYGSGDGPPDELALNNQAEAGNDPSWLSGPYLEMSESWQPIKVCVGGTQALRENAGELLPIEPKEDTAAWKRRVSHATLSPFLTRIADQAAGLICRKPITLQPREEGGEVDEYWTAFIEDVDGYGTSLDAYSRSLVLDSLLFGHCATLVDFPSTEAAPNLAVERQLGLRPYFLQVLPSSILGWRKDRDTPLAQINQVRINEYVTENLGAFGDSVVRQIRVLEQGKWSTWRQGEDGWVVHQEGTTSLPMIPLAVTYSNKLGELISKPPLLPIANLNLAHAQRNCDLFHSLHIAALPILILKGFDDTGNEIALSANSAIMMSEGGDAKYVEPASSAFQAQQNYITELENQMRSLGISTLFAQTFVGQTSEAKAMDRSDSDSMLSVVAQDLENCLQNAIDMAGAYVGMDTPLVSISRDFDLQKLDGPQVAQYLSMWSQGAISHQTLLEMLQRGEVLPDISIEEEIELINSSQLQGLDASSVGGVFTEEEEAESEEEPEEEDSAVRKEISKRMKKLTEDDDEEEDN